MMDDFTFTWPTKIIFGKGVEKKAGAECARALSESGKSEKKVLLHYGGGSIKETGLYDTIVRSLEASKVGFVELPGVKPNPRLSLVKEGIEFCRKEQIGLILAVGGGSVIDSAKAIGIGVPYEGDVWDFYSKRAVPKEALPLGCVLTIAAAGSETSFASVITKEDKGCKRAARFELLRPAFALMNPELTYTVNAYQTACGCADMMAHVLERYFVNTKGIGFTDSLCEATIQSITHYAPIALKKPRDYDARANLMWAGTVAHNGILNTGRPFGDWATHMIEHEVGGIYDVAHGAGLAALFPAWMEYVYKHDTARFARYAREVFGAGDKDDGKAALAGIEMTREFFRDIGMPVNLKELGVPTDRLEEMAERCTERGPVGSFVELHKKDVLAILKLAQ
jgi:alcohol dehydrogenase YqhD (iron-dependent ADH family)